MDSRGGSEESLGAHPGFDVEGHAHGILRVFADEDAVVSDGDVGARDDAQLANRAQLAAVDADAETRGSNLARETHDGHAAEGVEGVRHEGRGDP